MPICYYTCSELAFANCLVRTSLSARTAADASVGINYIDVTLADGHISMQVPHATQSSLITYAIVEKIKIVK